MSTEQTADSLPPIELRSSPALPPSTPPVAEDHLNVETATTSTSAGTQVPNAADSTTIEQRSHGVGAVGGEGGSTHSNSGQSTAPPSSSHKTGSAIGTTNNKESLNAFSNANPQQQQQFLQHQQQIQYLREHAGGAVTSAGGGAGYVPIRPWNDAGIQQSTSVGNPFTQQRHENGAPLINNNNNNNNNTKSGGIRSLNTVHATSLENMYAASGAAGALTPSGNGGTTSTNYFPVTTNGPSAGRLAYASNMQPLSYATDLSKLSNMSIASLGDYTLTDAQRAELFATAGGRSGSPLMNNPAPNPLSQSPYHLAGVSQGGANTPSPLRGGMAGISGGVGGPLGTVLAYPSFDSLVPHHGTPYSQSLPGGGTSWSPANNNNNNNTMNSQFHHHTVPSSHTHYGQHNPYATVADPYAQQIPYSGGLGGNTGSQLPQYPLGGHGGGHNGFYFEGNNGNNSSGAGSSFYANNGSVSASGGGGGNAGGANTFHYQQIASSAHQQHPYINGNQPQQGHNSNFYANISMAQSQQDLTSSHGGGTTSPFPRLASTDGISPNTASAKQNARNQLASHGQGGLISDFDFETAASQLMMEHHKKSVDSLVDEWLSPDEEEGAHGSGAGMLASSSSAPDLASHLHSGQQPRPVGNKPHPIVMLDPSQTTQPHRKAPSPVMGGLLPNYQGRPGGVGGGGGGIIVVTTTTPPTNIPPSFTGEENRRVDPMENPYGSFTVHKESRSPNQNQLQQQTYHNTNKGNFLAAVYAGATNTSSSVPAPTAPSFNASSTNQQNKASKNQQSSQHMPSATPLPLTATSITGTSDIVHAPSHHHNHGGNAHQHNNHTVAVPAHSANHHIPASDPIVTDFTLVDLDAKNTRQRKKNANEQKQQASPPAKGTVSTIVPSASPDFAEKLSTAAERAEKAIREAGKRFNVQIPTRLLEGLLKEGYKNSSTTKGAYESLFLFAPTASTSSSSSSSEACFFSPPAHLEPRYPKPDHYALISICKSEWLAHHSGASSSYTTTTTTTGDKNNNKKVSSNNSPAKVKDSAHVLCEDTEGRRRYEAHEPSIVSFRFHLCETFLVKGTCPRGVQCLFLHCTKALLSDLIDKSVTQNLESHHHPHQAQQSSDPQHSSSPTTILPPFVLCDVHFNTRITTKPLVHRTHAMERAEEKEGGIPPSDSIGDALGVEEFITVKNQKDSLEIPTAPIIITKGSRLVVEKLPDAPSKPQVCSHFARGLCPRGRHCCFVHFDHQVGPTTSSQTGGTEPQTSAATTTTAVNSNSTPSGTNNSQSNTKAIPHQASGSKSQSAHNASPNPPTPIYNKGYNHNHNQPQPVSDQSEGYHTTYNSPGAWSRGRGGNGSSSLHSQQTAWRSGNSGTRGGRGQGKW